MGHQMQMYYCEITNHHLITKLLAVQFIKFAFLNDAFNENVEAKTYKGHEAYVLGGSF